MNPTPTLLIVDDVPANLAVLIDALTQERYRVLLAENGERALRLAAQIRPDLILLDVTMPGLDGLETCRRLKANPALREIPVIFVTAQAEVSDKVAGLAAGGVDYVTKPLEPAEVIARVRVHLELRRLRLELQAEIGRRQEAERALRSSLDRAVLVTTLEGQILFATQRATRLLVEHFGYQDPGPLPAGLLAAVTTPTQTLADLVTSSGRLRVRRFAEVGDSECATLLLEEVGLAGMARLERLGLTPREAEVLFWMAEGKSNPEIALILANTAGTVKKQVQSVLDKLGFENRLLAARRAREILDAP
jgi:DNA-binding response OmpR family regulator/DNA-binding CsgD family transcriptional regulator